MVSVSNDHLLRDSEPFGAVFLSRYKVAVI